MKDDDVMAQLRAANRVTGSALSRTDRRALDALREGITMTTRPTTPARAAGRRFARRGALAAGLSLTVLGGGAAYAAYQQLYDGTDVDHLTCLTEWAPSAEGYPDARSGPPVTGDPVTDCQAIQADAGAAPIADPVAFELDGETFVAPRSQVPAAAVLLEESSPDGPAALELQASLTDWVDGLESRCHTPAQAVVFARAELDRLGLIGWQVDDSAGPGTLPCTGATVDTVARTVHVTEGGAETPPLEWPADDPSGHVYAIRDALRDDVAAACLTLEDAERVAVAAGADSPATYSIATIPDPDASCTRVDLVVGGSWLVTLRGPLATG